MHLSLLFNYPKTTYIISLLIYLISICGSFVLDNIYVTYISNLSNFILFYAHNIRRAIIPFALTHILIIYLVTTIPNIPYTWIPIFTLAVFSPTLGWLLARITIELDTSNKDRDKFKSQFYNSQKLESLGLLAGGIAHDFNNLLLGIQLQVDILEKEISTDNKDLRKSILLIQKGLLRASELTNQMLAYAGRGISHKTNLSISDTVKDMVKLIGASLPKKIKIDFNLKNDIPTIFADAPQISQIILNLITNSAEAIGDTYGSIKIKTDYIYADKTYLEGSYVTTDLRPGKYIIIEVSDTGCGIKSEEFAKIFDPFYTTKPSGRGLGLSVVFGIVKAMGGGVKIYSELGRGTTFIILFPVKNPQIEEPIKDFAAESLKGWKGSGTVLVIDDEELARESAKLTLIKYGFKVMVATCGYEGVEKFIKHKNLIKFVILDSTMPDMDGLEVLEKLRSVKINIPVILTSGYGNSEVITNCEKYGFKSFLRKPYRADELARLIKSTIG